MYQYDLAVVFGDDVVRYHQVWASNESDAQRTVSLFYRDSTVIGILFAASKEDY